MAELKTKENEASVMDFLNSVENEKRKKDALLLLDYVKELSDLEPKMWGDSIIGFGHLTYKYASGRTGEWFPFGFSPRKQNLTLYIPAYLETIPELINKISTKHGKGCLYIKDLEAVDKQDVLDLIEYSLNKGELF